MKSEAFQKVTPLVKSEHTDDSGKAEVKEEGMEADFDVKPSASQRKSSRLKNKGVPDWSHLRGPKKRLRPDTQPQASDRKAKKAKIMVLKSAPQDPNQEELVDDKHRLRVKEETMPQPLVKDEEDHETQLTVHNHDKKGKKEKAEPGLKLELDTRSRYEAAGIPLLPFPIPDFTEAIHGVQVPRMFISNTYGGSPQVMDPEPSKEKFANHGFGGFLFMPDALHPLAPQVPGAPGIFIEVPGGPAPNKIKRVSVRVQGSHKPPLWWYMGQYEFKDAQPLTKEEWSAQTIEVRDAWVAAVNRYSWGERMRASVKARCTLRREPTEEEVDAYKKGKRFASSEEIALALTRGDETFELFTMKCVGYDDRYQRDMASKYPAWLRATAQDSKGREKKPKRAAAATIKHEVSRDMTRVPSGRRLKVEESHHDHPMSSSAPEIKIKSKKSKKELGTLTLELDTTSRYQAAGIPLLPFAIPNYVDDIHGVQVPRVFFANTYGGSSQATFPKISAANLLAHGFDNFACLNDELHPLAPQVPGAPGVWISIGPDPRGLGPNYVKRVVARVKGTENPPLWWYMGQYDFQISQSLTKEEWATQTPQVRNAWSDAIVKNDWGNEVQASIKARNTLGREPTEEEVAAYERDERFATADEVALAFTRGDEQFYLFTMKCIGYDDSFQRDIAQRYPAWRQNR